jgi:hypothetical protein
MSFLIRHIFLSLLITVFANYGVANAEDYKAIQKTLKEEGFYQGAVDGKWGNMSAAALQNFQRRYGLKATGRLDDATREMLENNDRKTPDEAVMQPESIQETARHYMVTHAPPAPHSPLNENPDPVESFIRQYNNAAEQAVVDEAVPYFDDSVDYFGKGPTDLRFVKEDQKKYYSKWPIRHVEITAPPVVFQNADNTLTARFYTDYLVQNARYRLKGTSLNILKLRPVHGGYVITAIKENRLPEQPAPVAEKKDGTNNAR